MDLQTRMSPGAPMAPKILIVDPLTLIGREFTRCLEDAPELALEID